MIEVGGEGGQWSSRCAVVNKCASPLVLVARGSRPVRAGRVGRAERLGRAVRAVEGSGASSVIRGRRREQEQ